MQQTPRIVSYEPFNVPWSHLSAALLVAHSIDAAIFVRTNVHGSPAGILPYVRV